MNTACQLWIIWVDWEAHLLSAEPRERFEAVSFRSEESYQTNLRQLLDSGYSRE